MVPLQARRLKVHAERRAIVLGVKLNARSRLPDKLHRPHGLCRMVPSSGRGLPSAVLSVTSVRPMLIADATAAASIRMRLDLTFTSAPMNQFSTEGTQMCIGRWCRWPHMSAGV